MKNRLYLLLILITLCACPSSLLSKSKKRPKRRAAPVELPVIDEDVTPDNHTPVESGLETDPDSQSKQIRVCLAEHNSAHETKFLLKSPTGFILESPVGINQTAVSSKPELHLLCSGKSLFLQCKDGRYRRIKYPNIEVCTSTEQLTLNGTSYQGKIIFQLDEKNDTVLVINKLSLEDYVSSVVYSESIPSWPLSMQKIQAIVSRSYALFHMQQAQIKNPLFEYFDIRNTNLHQVYKGAHRYSHIKKAVDETKGLVVTNKNKIALAMFDSCCAGSCPALMCPKDYSKPYLMRSERCNYCSASTSYQWAADIHDGGFIRELKDSSPVSNKFKKFTGQLESITMSQIDKAGIIHKVKMRDKKGNTVTLTGSELRKSFPNKIKSLSFTIKHIRDRIVINGKGLGHQRGLCQWGAKQLVEDGWDVKKILRFYYPGTKLGVLA